MSMQEEEIQVILGDDDVIVIEVGIEGPPGPAADYKFAFVWVQGPSAAQWDIPHNLNGFPSVTVVNSANDVVEGDVTYVDVNNIRINFNGAFNGKAYLS